ncbi:hypothetical protein OS175_01960 [Marinicella sp. S1101]|uniref:exosortase H-associated membrane protein n=1 Tax=Marinicella marina TaxID=2996016 RepID=UPI002260A964|nr:exosortase H-associated membrane protein [Marinicella marina]MCX7552629.1 hypothetical protein [Marinicella marina]MDJ1139505.1 exosortase H-associated membrane protein [Marinicella marina]
MKSPIKELFFSALLFLPLCFFIWFFAASVWVLPVKWLADAVLSAWQPDLFNGITQQQFLFQVQTLIFPQDFAGQSAQLAVLDVTVNPMKYGYGLAVFSGLVISVPDLSMSKRVVQLMIGFAVVSVVQANGVFWETCKSLLFSGGGDAFAAIDATGISHNLVAAMYQMSYLIFPAVIPIVLWVLLNRQFIEKITQLNDHKMS